MIINRRNALAGALGTTLAAASGGTARAGGFDAAIFDRWISARAGDGSGPVYWYSTGTVHAFPSGQLLYRMEGYDAGRSFRPEPGRSFAHQYSRKHYIFRDPETGALIEEKGGRKADPIAYPYQFITYELKGDKVETFVEQGAEPRVQRISGGTTMVARSLGNSLVISAPLFLDFPIPGTGTRYSAWENYDFILDSAPGVTEPHKLSWARVGPLPSWAGEGMCVMHLVTWRVERFEDVPEGFRTYIEERAPLWKQPPADMAEIRRLQGRG